MLLSHAEVLSLLSLDFCVMCRLSSESCSHLFLHCPSASYQWNKLFGVSGKHGLFVLWTFKSSYVLISKDLLVAKTPKALGCSQAVVLWCIWLERNGRIFSDGNHLLSSFGIEQFHLLLCVVMLMIFLVVFSLVLEDFLFPFSILINPFLIRKKEHGSWCKFIEFSFT